MDQVTRAFYELHFELAFLKKKADEFQDFFSSVMEKGYPADFTRVRPWGNVGDKKNDGYLKSKRTLFQVYGPNDLAAKETIEKIGEDFTGALPHWKEYFDTWVFVHNSKAGLGPDVLKKLLDLETANPPIKVTLWGFQELYDEAFQLDEHHLASLFGPAPSRQGMVDLGLADLAPILDHISGLAPVDDPDIRPVSSEKLNHNQLSNNVAVLLRAGMGRADLVKKYFKAQPTKKDQIAETFKGKYTEIREQGTPPDEIFAQLQRFAGGDLLPSPAKQNGVLAVLAHFFEACDIFESPNAIGETA